MFLTQNEFPLDSKYVICGPQLHHQTFEGKSILTGNKWARTQQAVHLNSMQASDWLLETGLYITATKGMLLPNYMCRHYFFGQSTLPGCCQSSPGWTCTAPCKICPAPCQICIRSSKSVPNPHQWGWSHANKISLRIILLCSLDYHYGCMNTQWVGSFLGCR